MTKREGEVKENMFGMAGCTAAVVMA